MITTVTGKNQIPLPAAIANQLQISAGTRVQWSVDAQGLITLRVLPNRAKLAEEAAGLGRAWLEPGQSAVADLIAERAQDDHLCGPPKKALAEVLREIPAVGLDEDFERVQD
jgi:antitoxin component of MazEF toxin-antitoxin module